jgi:hypothetical protein
VSVEEIIPEMKEENQAPPSVTWLPPSSSCRWVLIRLPVAITLTTRHMDLYVKLSQRGGDALRSSTWINSCIRAKPCRYLEVIRGKRMELSRWNRATNAGLSSWRRKPLRSETADRTQLRWMRI